MNEQKTCPLLGAGPLGVNTNCKGDRCAWWTGAECAMLCVAEALGSLDTSGIIIYEGVGSP